MENPYVSYRAEKVLDRYFREISLYTTLMMSDDAEAPGKPHTLEEMYDFPSLCAKEIIEVKEEGGGDAPGKNISWSKKALRERKKRMNKETHTKRTLLFRFFARIFSSKTIIH